MSFDSFKRYLNAILVITQKNQGKAFLLPISILVIVFTQETQGKAFLLPISIVFTQETQGKAFPQL